MIVEPRQSPLDEVSRLAQTRAVGIVHRSGQERPYASLARRPDIRLPTISAVALVDSRAKPRPSDRPLDRRDGVQKHDGHLPVGHVRRGGDQRQRQTGGVDDQVPFAAVFPAIGGVWAGMAPPKTARTEALSTKARDRSTRRSRPKVLRIRCQTAGQTSASVQDRKRRQHVVPSPQPSSAGRSFHAQPVRSTKTMPTRHRRSGMRGRPPLGLGGSAGKSGLTCSQRPSLTHWRAIGVPPCKGPMTLIDKMRCQD
jgi:hypothetical protein